ncbi:conserved exported hypothetical protein [Cupriavidus taiwanensis]|nr:conserved exported hypothetical protein [Cupriavidus taiwanensis]
MKSVAWRLRTASGAQAASNAMDAAAAPAARNGLDAVSTAVPLDSSDACHLMATHRPRTPGRPRCSVVQGLVHRRRPALPVGRRANALLVDATLRDQVLAHHLHRRTFTGSPHIALAARQRELAQRAFQQAAFWRIATMQPVHVRLRGARQRDLRGGIAHFQHDDGMGAGAQLFQPARDRRQRRIVTDQQVPVEPCRHHERTARPAHAQVLALPRLGRPRRRGAIAMQHEFEVQLLFRGIVAARRIVACRRARLALRKHDAVRGDLRQHRLVIAGGREKHLDVIVERRRDKVLQVGAAQRHAQQLRRNLRGAQHLQQAHLQRMAHALDGQVAFGFSSVCRHIGIPCLRALRLPGTIAEGRCQGQRHGSGPRARFYLGRRARQDRGNAALLVGTRFTAHHQRLLQRGARLHQLGQPAAPLRLRLLLAPHRPAHPLHLARHVAQPRHHDIDPLAVGRQVRLAGLRQLVALLVAFGVDGGKADFFQIRQRGIDHAGAGLVEAVGARLQRLDQFVAMAGLFLQQRQQQQLQVVGAELAAATPAFFVEAAGAAGTESVIVAAAPEAAAVAAAHGVLSHVRGKAHHEMAGPAGKVRIGAKAMVMRVMVMHEALRCVARHILRYISYELKSSQAYVVKTCLPPPADARGAQPPWVVGVSLRQPAAWPAGSRQRRYPSYDR